MDFIEKIFGVTPDGGSGTLEVALIVAVVIVATLVVVVRNRTRAGRPGR